MVEQKIINGITLLGIASTSIFLSKSEVGWGKWCLIIAAASLAILGLIEIFRKESEK